MRGFKLAHPTISRHLGDKAAEIFSTKRDIPRFEVNENRLQVPFLISCDRCDMLTPQRFILPS